MCKKGTLLRKIKRKRKRRSHLCQVATSMRLRVPTGLTPAGVMITALATENARPGAGAMVIHTVMLTCYQTFALLMNHKTQGALTGAITLWSATATGPALFGAGAKANPTAELNYSLKLP